MNRAQVVIQHLLALQHQRRKGHLPAWYNMGAGERQCVNCMRGGKGGRQWMLVPAPRPL